MKSPPTDRPVIVLRGGTTVSIEVVGEALAALAEPDFIAVLEEVTRRGGAPHLEMLLRAIVIQQTTSLFLDPTARGIVERVATEYPLSRWLTEMAVPLTSATRAHVIAWWDNFMTMAAELGYRGHGRIDEMSQGTNLWQATATLAARMRTDPAKYRFLPALLINHATEVARVLAEISDPEAFLEVLTGEAMPEARESPIFLGAFSTVMGTDGTVSRTVPDALYSVGLALKRGTIR